MKEMDNMQNKKDKIGKREFNQKKTSSEKGKNMIQQEIENEDNEEEDLLDIHPLNHIYNFDTFKVPIRIKEKIENF